MNDFRLMIKPRRKIEVPHWLLAFFLLPLLLHSNAHALDPLFSSSSGILSDFKLRVETKGHLRSSASNRFPVAFPFEPTNLPLGESTAFEESVEEGEHFELSEISLSGNWKPANQLTFHFNIDWIDKYDRNPTSSDRKFDIDELWARYGTRTRASQIAEQRHVYLQFGKFAKFERQNDRHLESYGLLATAFNRFEDAGLEVGADLFPWMYLRFSWMSGNPLFIRDPNALAGDNGVFPPDSVADNFDPRLKTGVVVLYDAEVEDLRLFSKPEFGANLGFRFGDEGARRIGDLSFWAYARNLKDEVNLNGTFYGGDIDILDAGGFGFELQDNDKRDFGINFWGYYENTTVFFQGVYQDVGGLKRRGVELEFSHALNGPTLIGNSFGKWIPFITPVIRYSAIDPDFSGDPRYPAPSVEWDWQKFDVGLRLSLLHGFRLSAEYAFNRFERDGTEEDNDEFLATLHWRGRLLN